MTDDSPGPGDAGPVPVDAGPVPVDAGPVPVDAGTEPATVVADGAARLPRLSIEYCTQCRWLLRAGWVAQELLQTFRTRLGEVALVPGTDGVFRVMLDAGNGPELLWDRKVDGGFPEIPDLKRRVRDAVAPDLSLGHTDRVAGGDDAQPAAD